jgi:subtilisin family serine protease
VSGAAALVRSRFPHLSAEEVVHRLTATAIDKGPPGRDDEYGYGVLNILGALTADVPPLAGASRMPDGTAVTGPAPTPSVVAPTLTMPMPRNQPASSRISELVAAGVLAVTALVVLLLVLSRRRSSS